VLCGAFLWARSCLKALSGGFAFGHGQTPDAAKKEQNVAFVMAAARLRAAMFQNNTFGRQPNVDHAVADADPVDHLPAEPAEALDFSGLGFGDLGARAICLDISRGRKAHELDISRNMVTQAGAAELLTVIVRPGSQLRNLVLSGNKIADGQNAEALRREIEEYQDSERPGDIQMVRAYRAKLQRGTIAMDRLTRVLGGDALPTLAVLHLSKTGIGNVGAEILAASLHQNTALQELALGDNRISNPGAHQFAAMLKVDAGLHNCCAHNLTHNLTSDLWPRPTPLTFSNSNRR
jgi:hypothetical protein